jgi:argininosuccinate synthase
MALLPLVINPFCFVGGSPNQVDVDSELLITVINRVMRRYKQVCSKEVVNRRKAISHVGFQGTWFKSEYDAIQSAVDKHDFDIKGIVKDVEFQTALAHKHVFAIERKCFYGKEGEKTAKKQRYFVSPL